MLEKEKQILETITKTINSMSEFEKGYLLGMGEAIAAKTAAEKKEGEDNDREQRSDR